MGPSGEAPKVSKPIPLVASSPEMVLGVGNIILRGYGHRFRGSGHGQKVLGIGYAQNLVLGILGRPLVLPKR